MLYALDGEQNQYQLELNDRLIPAGTGFVHHQERRARREAESMFSADAEQALSEELSEAEQNSEAGAEE